MSATHCLNCNTSLQGKYCHVRGQKGSTHRLSLKHFFLHDFVHGFWHLDGSLPRTLKNVLLLPGKAANDYIAGKRAGTFNLVTLLLILVGVNLYIANNIFHESTASDSGPLRIESTVAENAQETVDAKKLARIKRRAEVGDRLEETLQQNMKWLILGTVPILSLTSLVFFRRARYNYAEHIIVAAFFIITFWQAHRYRYTLAGWAWRLLATFFFFLLTLVVTILAIGVVFMRSHGFLTTG